jgi:hypothetical protein
MTENIAEEIRHRPDYGEVLGERHTLATQRERLRLSLEVVDKWLAAADPEESDTLHHRAQQMRDKIEEEYSRLCFEMEARERRRVFRRVAEDPDEKPPVSEAKMLAGMISDALMDAYVALSDISLDRRHKIMGALMVARDALPEEMPGPEPLH